MFRLWFKHFNQNPPLSSGGSLINLKVILGYFSALKKSLFFKCLSLSSLEVLIQILKSSFFFLKFYIFLFNTN